MAKAARNAGSSWVHHRRRRLAPQRENNNDAAAGRRRSARAHSRAAVTNVVVAIAVVELINRAGCRAERDRCGILREFRSMA
jgi:hypothetical protein